MILFPIRLTAATARRTACKRFERVNEKTELYNDYSAKGVNIK